MDDYTPPPQHQRLVNAALEHARTDQSPVYQEELVRRIALYARALAEAVDTFPENEQPRGWAASGKAVMDLKYVEALRKALEDMQQQRDTLTTGSLRLVQEIHELRENVVGLTREKLRSVDLGREQQRREEHVQRYPVLFVVTYEGVPEYPGYLSLDDAKGHGGALARKGGWTSLKWVLGDTQRPYPVVWELTAVMGSSDRDETSVKIVEMPMVSEASESSDRGPL